MHAFKYHRPSSVNDAAALAKGEAKLLAGGQTLVQTMKLRLASPRRPTSSTSAPSRISPGSSPTARA
jgi:CO/xanthine dehydrogenase FAD-binding subunit